MRVLKGHGHWVNTLALSTEHALRTGPFDHHGQAPREPAAAQQAAQERCGQGSGALWHMCSCSLPAWLTHGTVGVPGA